MLLTAQQRQLIKQVTTEQVGADAQVLLFGSRVDDNRHERLFASAFDAVRARSLAHDVDLAERVDAFVARFGRLQDTLADKLLPALRGEVGRRFGGSDDRGEASAS